MRIEDGLFYPDPCEVRYVERDVWLAKDYVDLAPGEKFESGGSVTKDVFRVLVKGENYKVCADKCKELWLNEKEGKYGEGIANNESDPTRVQRLGLLSETAFAAILLKYEIEVPVNMQRIKGGTPHDFDTGELKIDIKVAVKKTDRNTFLAVGKTGRPADTSDAYVAAYTESDDPENERAVFCFVGWEPLEVIKERGFKQPAKQHRDGRKNYEMWFHETQPIKPFIERCAKAYQKMIDQEESREAEQEYHSKIRK